MPKETKEVALGEDQLICVLIMEQNDPRKNNI